VIVITVDGQQQTVTGRAARIALWLATNRASLDAPDKVKLEFNCAGQHIDFNLVVKQDGKI
jgi:hypothetical protein